MSGNFWKELVRDFRTRLAVFQCVYYVVTGVWPLFSIRTFETITGPKVDRWLVKLVGTLIAIIGGVVGLAALRQRLTPEVHLLTIFSAASFAAVDVIYATRGRISLVYLLDAALEAGIIGGWLVGVARARREASLPARRHFEM